MINKTPFLRAAAALFLAAVSLCASAAKQYDDGASDTEIKLGQTMAYSGPVSASGQYGKAHAAYFKMVNDRGGINGRKINLISLDDGYSPPRTVEAARRLVEREKILAFFQNLGTAPNNAIQRYVETRKVPNLFVISGDEKWADAVKSPYTTSWQPSNETETRVYARHILSSKPDARIAVLYQNDDYGKAALAGFKDELGAKVGQIVAEASYEVSDPTTDSQIVGFKAANANVLVSITTPKFAAQAIRKVRDIGWAPTYYLNSLAASVNAVLQPAGLDRAKDIISVAYLKDPSDPRWKDDAAMKDYHAFMKKYMPDANAYDTMNVFGYSSAQTMESLLRQCGDDLTRANLLAQAARLHNLQLPLALPGVVINTTPRNRTALRSMQLVRFDGERWQTFGDVISIAGKP